MKVDVEKEKKILVFLYRQYAKDSQMDIEIPLAVLTFEDFIAKQETLKQYDAKLFVRFFKTLLVYYENDFYLSDHLEALGTSCAIMDSKHLAIIRERIKNKDVKNNNKRKIVQGEIMKKRYIVQKITFPYLKIEHAIEASHDRMLSDLQKDSLLPYREEEQLVLKIGKKIYHKQ